ncbi:MAG: hypothetical protein FD138_662 [Planctomycetota bacterium]|nr:MAG: hypothetical protein FD138_662 [Planctomycetota bacterium]
MKSLFNDENGFVVSAELILVSTIVVLGLIVGLTEVRQAVSEELEDVAAAIGAMNQSYTYAGLKTNKSCLSGSRYFDDRDYCDSQFDIVGTPAIDEDH